MHMNKLFLVLSAVSLGALAQPYPLYVANAAAPSSSPARLEGMSYVPARRIILSYGWVRAAGPCTVSAGLRASDCESFPELDVCSPVSPGYCSIVFTRRGLCLDILTTGGPPVAGQERGDTEVFRVNFRRGRCWRVAFDALERHGNSASRRRAGHAR
jgi:hypothetical protein